MRTIQRWQISFLCGMFAVQILMLWTIGLREGSVVPPLLFALPIGWLGYKALLLGKTGFEPTPKIWLTALLFAGLAASGLLLGRHDQFRFWLSLPVLTDVAILMPVALMAARLASRRAESSMATR